MRNTIFFAALTLFLSACASPLTATPTVEPTAVSSEVAALPEFACTSVGSADRDNFLANSPYDPVVAEDHVRGAENAAVSLIEYSDFQCPFCAQLEPVLAELEARYPDDLQVVYRHFPLIGTPDQPIHDKAALAMQAAEAAARQGKFWEMHDALFAGQNDWTGKNLEDFGSWLKQTAGTLGLDLAQFNADLHSDELGQMAQDAWDKGQALQLSGTPFILINGLPYSGPLDVNNLDAIMQLEMLQKRQFTECPEMILEPGANYTATLHTEKGDIIIQLYPDVAPMAVNNFVFLAQQDWYDNVTFHRVLPGFVAQAGDPSATGIGGPGYTFAIEIDPNLTFDRAGLVAMANAGPTANGSQFFITLAPAENLNGQYTIFGEVIQGMDVVERLTPRNPQSAAGLPPGDKILDVTIEVD